uniref:SANTA domain-containing protein n=3 Tax=Parascaris univalens TaxID=6257 RepID=A0A915B3H0_PARUN
MAATQPGNLIASKNPDIVGLKLWIFKLVWDEFAVCVEGYRAKDEGELELCNWRSTPVVQRVNSRVLLTRSGTKYVLQGIVDEESLLALGYPRVLIDQFKDGFPPNWDDILHQYHHSLTKNNLMNSSQWFITSSICGSTTAWNKSSLAGTVLGELQPKQVSRRRSSALLVRQGQHNVASEKIIEEEERGTSKPIESSQLKKINHRNEECKSSREQTCDESEKSKEKVSGTADEVFKVPKSPLAIARSLPAVKLYNWTVLFAISDLGYSTLFADFGLVIEGYREAEQCDWKTSCIVAVRDGRHVETASTVYELAGPINTMVAAQQGYPKEFVAHFLNGFPDDWHAVISKFFATYVKPHMELEERRRSAAQPSRGVTERDSGAWSVDGESDGSDVDTNTSARDDSAQSPSSFESSKIKPPRASNGANKRAAPRMAGKASPWRKRIASRKPSKKMTVKGQQRRSVEKESMVRTSRSGRVVKRPLARWAGERIVYDVNGEPVKAVGITTESMMTNGGGIETSAVMNHLGLSPPTGPKQHEKGSFDLPLQKTRKKKKRPLVTYSSSQPSSDEDYMQYARESPTPFHRKPHKQTWHVISSSPEEEERREGGSRKARKRKQKDTKKSSKGKGIVRKRSSKQVPAGQCGKEKQTGRPITDEVSSMVDDALSDNVEESITIAESDASDVRTSERANFEGVLETKTHDAPRCWRRDEIDRLKLAVRAIKPREDSDWVKVASSLGGRDAADCLAEAQKKLGWKPQKRLTRLEEDRQLEKLACAAGKAKVGTISYQVKAQRFTRKYVMAGGESDFFEDAMDLDTGTMMTTMPSVVEFDPDDSLLNVVRTPGDAEIKHSNRHEFIPDLASPNESPPGRSRLSPTLFAVDSAERDRRERYVRRLLKDKSYNSSHLNASSVNVSKGCARRNYKLNIPSSTI